MLLGIALDTVALIVIVSVMARENLAEEWFRFVLLAFGVSIGGVLLILFAPAIVAFVGYFALVFLGLRFVVGTSWLGSLIAGGVFIGYKILLGIFFATAFSV